jgi:hypothetical protein
MVYQEASGLPNQRKVVHDLTLGVMHARKWSIAPVVNGMMSQKNSQVLHCYVALVMTEQNL